VRDQTLLAWAAMTRQPWWASWIHDRVYRICAANGVPPAVPLSVPRRPRAWVAATSPKVTDG
jgi:hypothetical protein